MRAVNLLPRADRAVIASAPREAAHLVVGGLAALLIAVLLLVFSQNQITGRENQLAKLGQEQQAAQQRAASLGAFGQFAQIKQTRVQSISDTAKTRFDWERLMRELALVLPDGTWLSGVNASSSGSPDATSSSSPSTDAAAASAAPSAEISGCAKSQSRVAELMVRVRSLHRADDVTLAESTGPQDDAAAGAPAGGDDGSSAGSCGKYYTFKATVIFSEAGKREGPDGKRVPSRLGGGS